VLKRKKGTKNSGHLWDKERYGRNFSSKAFKGSVRGAEEFRGRSWVTVIFATSRRGIEGKLNQKGETTRRDKVGKRKFSDEKKSRTSKHWGSTLGCEMEKKLGGEAKRGKLESADCGGLIGKTTVM